MLINRTTLSRALNNAARIASSRATLPVLANVKLARVGADLYLQATDLERGLEQRIAIDEGADDFSTTVNAKMLDASIASMADAQVELTLNERGTKLTVKSGRAVVEFPTIPAGEFPPFAVMPVGEPVDPAAFVDAAARVMVAASTEEARPVLQGVYSDGATMAATDGFRIHVIPFAMGKANIPARTMAEAVKLFSKAEYLKVASGAGQWFITDGDTTLISQTIEGNFPDWTVIAPKEHKATVEFQVQALLASLRRVQVIQPANNVIKLEFGETGITITGQSEETGTAEDVVDAVVTGVPPMIAVNVRFFVQALEAVRINPARLHVNQANTPLVVEDSSGWRAVVMPMHLEGK